VGLSTSKKKKKECAPNKQARAKSNSAKLLVGRSFFKLTGLSHQGRFLLKL
jgi:hypothetical protein